MYERNDSGEGGGGGKTNQTGERDYFWDATSRVESRQIGAVFCAGPEYDWQRGGIRAGQSARNFADGVGLLLSEKVIVRSSAENKSVLLQIESGRIYVIFKVDENH